MVRSQLFSIPALVATSASFLVAGVILPLERVRAQTFPETPSEHLPPLTNAQQAVEFVSQDRAYRYATPVQIYSGRSTVIDFRTDEAITFIQLSDLSEVVYQTNAPLESGQATLITLRPIHPLNFEGATRSPVPNLIVTTVDRGGNQRSYVFNLVLASGQPLSDDINGIAILPPQETEQERLAHQRNRQGNPPQTVSATALDTGVGSASIEDFRVGLEVSIEEDYTPADDPIVAAARQVIDVASQGVPFRQAIDETDFPMDVAIALAEIGAENRLRRGIDAEAGDSSTEEGETPSSSLVPMPDFEELQFEP